MSIFQKDCPQCAGSNPSDALFCRCGYCYDPSQVNSHDDALTHVVNEEQNYLEYLSARVTQTQADLDRKLAAQALTSNDATLSAEVLLARQALSSARAELKSQSEKVESLNRQRKSVRRESRAPMPAAVSTPAAKPHNVRANANKPSVAAPAPAAKLAPVVRTVAQPPKLIAPPKVTARPVAAHPVRVIKPATPAVRALPAKPAPVALKPVAQKPETIRPAVSDTPGAAFHAVQAAKADKVIPRQSPAPVAAPVAALAPISSASEIDRKTAVAAPALPEAHTNGQECPNCMARLPASINKCRCGFDLTSRFEMPALSLSAAERALLLSNLDYGS